MMLKTLLIAVILAVLVGLLFPAISTPGRHRGKSEAKAAVSQLAAALNQYHIEYGKWPGFTQDGLFLDTARNAQLMRTLRAQDEVNNPRKMILFESRPASKRSGKLAGGFDPATGAFLDTWGNPYRIILDADEDGTVTNPYDGEPIVRMRAIVWSLGKDGKQGVPGNDRSFRGSDDLLSWQ